MKKLLRIIVSCHPDIWLHGKTQKRTERIYYKCNNFRHYRW